MPELAISAWRSYAVKLAKCPPPLIGHDLSLFKTKSRRSVGVAIMKRKLFSKETSIGEISAELTYLFKLSLYCTHSRDVHMYAVCMLSPPHAIFSEASHWPPGHMISSRTPIHFFSRLLDFCMGASNHTHGNI